MWALSMVGLALAAQAGLSSKPAEARGSSAGDRHSSITSEVTTDWPGCGGVCGVRLRPDYLVLDMSSASAPAAGVRLTLIVLLREDTTGGDPPAFDVTSAFGAGQSGVVALDGADIPGGTANVASAVLAWASPGTGGAGKETIPLL